ncbi:hypothetical protein Trydic_g3559 [Trypoxylus dichotomus]
MQERIISKALLQTVPQSELMYAGAEKSSVIDDIAVRANDGEVKGTTNHLQSEREEIRIAEIRDIYFVEEEKYIKKETANFFSEDKGK